MTLLGLGVLINCVNVTHMKQTNKQTCKLLSDVAYFKALVYFTAVVLNEEGEGFCPPEDIGQCLETFLVLPTQNREQPQLTIRAGI